VGRREADPSAALRDDSQKGKGKGKAKARANAKARAKARQRQGPQPQRQLQLQTRIPCGNDKQKGGASRDGSPFVFVIVEVISLRVLRLSLL
jgi:hypothetical protein